MTACPPPPRARHHRLDYQLTINYESGFWCVAWLSKSRRVDQGCAATFSARHRISPLDSLHFQQSSHEEKPLYITCRDEWQWSSLRQGNQVQICRELLLAVMEGGQQLKLSELFEADTALCVFLAVCELFVQGDNSFHSGRDCSQRYCVLWLHVISRLLRLALVCLETSGADHRCHRKCRPVHAPANQVLYCRIHCSLLQCKLGLV